MSSYTYWIGQIDELTADASFTLLIESVSWKKQSSLLERAHEYYNGMTKDQFKKMEEFIADHSYCHPQKTSHWLPFRTELEIDLVQGCQVSANGVEDSGLGLKFIVDVSSIDNTPRGFVCTGASLDLSNPEVLSCEAQVVRLPFGYPNSLNKNQIRVRHELEDEKGPVVVDWCDLRACSDVL
ncbi:hypothetical protein Tco_0708030 [Tanacetum coccineum]